MSTKARSRSYVQPTIEPQARVINVEDEANNVGVDSSPNSGALETGKPETRYGPRWLTWQPFYR